MNKETNCSDRVDNDGDGLADCGDSDCFASDACKADGGPENTNDRCSDWIDNDKDGYVDCDDKDCGASNVTACKGSWSGPLERRPGGKNPTNTNDEKIPELGPGMTVEDLIGRGSDKDGERNDVLCSDGFDNDSDGKTDCADYGCRFDPTVTVCRGNPGMRFSVVGSVAFSYDVEGDLFDTRFSKLQLRSFGPMPYIQNSFYLISMRAEKTPRLTFAMFQVPLGKGHTININSGGGGLSGALVLSSAKNLMLDPPYYMYNAFEQGNGAAAEVEGPLDGNGYTRYRAYVAGGSGRFAGNVGGRYFTFDNTNFTWSTGAQVGINIVGQYSRWDSQFLYTPSALAVGLTLGGKYDQRAQEQYVATNARLVARYKYFSFAAENYTKKEFEFDSWQTSYNVQVGWLAIPKHLIVGADFGEFIAYDMGNPPDVLETDLKRQLNELQWRVALHWYFWRNVGVATLMYIDREVEPSDKDQKDPDRERRAFLNVQYRF